MKKTDDAIYELFEKLDQIKPSDTKPTRKIAIFATQRTGSNYFCDLLMQTNVLGMPREYFNLRFLAAYAKYFKLQRINIHDYINFIVSKTTNKSGVFSVKILMEQYIFFLKEKKIDLLSLKFDDIILISRRDKIAQSYSFAKAALTDQWTSNLIPNADISPSDIKNSFILEKLHIITLWEEFFKLTLANKVTLKYEYEDFFINEINFSNKVFKDLNIDFDNEIKSRLKKQSNQNDLNRIEQFKKYLNLN